MPKPIKSASTVLTELRARHLHCVTFADIKRDMASGRLPAEIAEKWKDKGWLIPACSEPGDVACAAPTVSDSYLLEKIDEARSEATRDI